MDKKLEFVPGKKYVDRKGNVYTFIHEFKNQGFPLAFESNIGQYASRKKDGHYERQTLDHPFDIVAEYVEPVYAWFNVYKENFHVNGKNFKRIGEQKPTKSHALDAASYYKPWYLYTVRINLNTGETWVES